MNFSRCRWPRSCGIPRPSVASTRGYDPPANQALAATLGNASPPDLQEMFGMGDFELPNEPYNTQGHGRDFFAANLWPERPAGMRRAFRGFIIGRWTASAMS